MANQVEELIEHVLNPKNIWDPSTFIKTRHLNCLWDNAEIQITASYVSGGFFIFGYIGKARFKLVGNPTGVAIEMTSILDDEYKNVISKYFKFTEKGKILNVLRSLKAAF